MSATSFPSLPGITWPVKRSADWITARYEALGGARTVNPMRSVPRWRWQLSYEFLRNALYSDANADTYSELQTLYGFWNARSADGMVFAYTDDADNTATDEPFGQGDGATTQFQLYRALGGFAEPVYAPTVTGITVAGSPAGSYTVGDTGVVTFASAPASAADLAWTGTFAFLCRFDADSIDLQEFMSGISESNTALSFSSEIGL